MTDTSPEAVARVHEGLRLCAVYGTREQRGRFIMEGIDLIEALAARVRELEAENMRLSEALTDYETATHSHIDGRDFLEELNPAGWHHCDIEVRQDGINRRFEGDWLKGIWYARKRARAALEALEQAEPSGPETDPGAAK